MGHLLFGEHPDPSENNLVFYPLLKGLYGFCVCSFMHKIYVIRGQNNLHKIINSCVCYDIKRNKWTKLH